MSTIKASLTVYTEGGPYHVRKTKNGESVMLTSQVSQVINLSEDFISNAINNPVKGVTPREWKRMGKNTRIAAHMKEYAEYLGSDKFDFIIY